MFHISQKKAARDARRTKLMAWMRVVADELSAVKSLVASCTVRL